jgi:hypothetical protein
MFDHVARELLSLMGRKDQVPSAMYPEDVPWALSKLRHAVAAMPDDYGSAGTAGSDDDDQEASVGLKVRALPLIDLLEASARKHAHVMWDFE